MSKVLKLVSFTAASSAAAASYYYYAVNKNGYLLENARWKQLNDKVQNIIDGKEAFQYVGLSETIDKPTELVIRTRSETFKDLWNGEVRRAVNWIYSLGGQ